MRQITIPIDWTLSQIFIPRRDNAPNDDNYRLDFEPDENDYT